MECQRTLAVSFAYLSNQCGFWFILIIGPDFGFISDHWAALGIQGHRRRTARLKMADANRTHHRSATKLKNGTLLLDHRCDASYRD